MISRRQKLGGILVVLSATWMLAGCTSAWVSEAASIINTLVPAISGILGIIMAFGGKVPPEVTSAVQKYSTEAINDLNNVVKPLIDQYNAVPQAQKPTVLEQISDAVKVVLNNWEQALGALHIDDQATQAKVVAVMQLVENELKSLMSVIPVIQGKASIHDSDVSMPLDAAHFQHKYNQLVEEFGSQYQIS